MPAPDLKLVVKRKKLYGPTIDVQTGEPLEQKAVWLQVGTAAIWFGKDGATTGKLELNMFEGDFHIFDKERKDGKDDVGF